MTFATSACVVKVDFCQFKLLVPIQNDVLCIKYNGKVTCVNSACVVKVDVCQFKL